MRFRSFSPLPVRLRPLLTTPRLRRWIPGFARLILGPYLRTLGYRNLRVSGGEAAARLWEDHYQGKIRLIVAFRHNYGMDPQLMGAAVLRGLRLKRKPGLPRVPFVQFVHNFDVGWWGGPLARWAIPRAGGLPVDHARMSPRDLHAMRNAIADGFQPLALAPEGGVSYLSRRVVRIEPGFARLGFLAAEDLAAQGREEPVKVLPVSFLHEYPSAFPKKFDRSLLALEDRALGRGRREERLGKARWERVRDLKAALLGQAESWYSQLYGFRPPDSGDQLLALSEHALFLAETMLGLAHEGEFFARFWRVVTVGWERQYIDPAMWNSWSEHEKARAKRPNTEAWLAFRHAYFAELGWFLRLEDPAADSSLPVLADQLENLGDLLVRLEGGNLGNRPVLFTRTARAIFGDTIDLTARLPQYRQARKSVLAETIDELARQWTNDIKEHDRG